MSKRVPLLVENAEGIEVEVGEVEINDEGDMISSTVFPSARVIKRLSIEKKMPGSNARQIWREGFLCPACALEKCLGILVGNPHCVCCEGRHGR